MRRLVPLCPPPPAAACSCRLRWRARALHGSRDGCADAAGAGGGAVCAAGKYSDMFVARVRAMLRLCALLASTCLLCVPRSCWSTESPFQARARRCTGPSRLFTAPAACGLRGGVGDDDAVALEYERDRGEKAKRALAIDLRRAADQGDLPALRRALALGAVVDGRDCSGYTALHLAAEKGHTDSVEVLLEQVGGPLWTARCCTTRAGLPHFPIGVCSSNFSRLSDASDVKLCVS